MTDSTGKTPVELTANIVSAYLSNNPTQASEIPNLISQVHAALLRVSTGRVDAPLEPAKPAVTILKSGIVDGMAYSLYSDGSIEAQMPEGLMRFASIDELRAHLDKRA